MDYPKMYSALFFATQLLVAAEVSGDSKDLTSLPKTYYYTPKSNDFYTSGDLLVWQPYTQDSLSWVDYRRIDPTSSNRFHDDFKNLTYGWEAGFRVALGYRLGATITGSQVRPWQIETNYQQLIATVSETLPLQGGTSGTNFLIGNLLPIIDTGDPMTFAGGSSTASLSYRHLNLEVAWPIWISENVIWRLLTGASYAWFHNVWNTVYSTVPIGSTVVGSRGNSYDDFSWKFAGGGLLAATDFHMEVGKGIGFFATGKIDLLVGRVSLDEHYRMLAQADSQGGEEPIQHLDKNYLRNFVRVQPAFSLGAGLDYKYWFTSQRLMAYASLGYEWMLWLNLNQFGRVNERGDAGISPTAILSTTMGNIFDAEPSSLGFQGATVRFGLEF